MSTTCMSSITKKKNKTNKQKSIRMYFKNLKIENLKRYNRKKIFVLMKFYIGYSFAIYVNFLFIKYSF